MGDDGRNGAIGDGWTVVDPGFGTNDASAARWRCDSNGSGWRLDGAGANDRGPAGRAG
jgi:hypothetical protein